MQIHLNIGMDPGVWAGLMQTATHAEMIAAFEALQKFFSFVEGRMMAAGDLSAAAWGEMAEDAGDIVENVRKIALLHATNKTDPPPAS